MIESSKAQQKNRFSISVLADKQYALFLNF